MNINKLTQGQRVTFRTDKDDKELHQGKISLDHMNGIYLCHNNQELDYSYGDTCHDSINHLGFSFSLELRRDHTDEEREESNGIYDLQPAVITWDNIEPGDTFKKGKDTNRLTDTSKNGLICYFAPIDSSAETYGYHATKEYMKNNYTIIQSNEEVEELTVEEISKRLGKTIKIVKTK
jgi:hypothetical protein